MDNFKVIIVEDVPLELKGTEGIFKNDIPEAEIDTIKKQLLTTPKEVYKTWGKDISHGMSEADEKLFEKIVFSPKNFTIPQSGNF